MILRILILTCILFFASAENSNAEGLIDKIEGVYKSRFQNGLVSGESYMSEDIVEVLKVSAKTAYINYRLEFFNGHSCRLSGIAEEEGDKLIYREKTKGLSCVLSIEIKDKKLRTNDLTPENAGHNNCKGYCGVRGSFHNFTIDMAKKRKIRYTKRILGSPEYKYAIELYNEAHQPK